MASSDRRSKAGSRDRRVIYRISDSRQHLVGPSRLGSLATIYHPQHSCRPADPVPVHSHLPELIDPDNTAGHTNGAGHHDSTECAGFVAAGSWGASAPETTEGNHHPVHVLEGYHPILNAIIEDSHPATETSQETSGFARSYSTSPSVLELIPELQRPQSHYYINSSSSLHLGYGSSTSVGSSGWMYGFDWSLPSIGTSDQWSGHLKSVLLDVLTPSSDSSLPTILQPRFKKSPGTSAALFVPSVMASIWRKYSDENETSPEVRIGSAAKRPIVNFNKEDYAAPISSFRAKGIPLNKGKNAKTACLSASVKRSSAYDTNTEQSGRRTHRGQNHDMAGGRLTRWHSLLKYVLTGLTKQTSPVELQDMSSYPTTDEFPCPNNDNSPEEPAETPLGDVTFFHYNSDGAEYTCTRVPITSPPRAKPNNRGRRKKRLSCTSSDSMVIVEYKESEEEEEEIDEKVIETVLIQEFDHDHCECTRVSSDSSVNDGCSVDAECCSFVNGSLSSEFSADNISDTPVKVVPNGNVNGNCLENDGVDAVPHSVWKRRTSTIKRIPKILKNKKRKVKFAVQPTNHKRRPIILGLDNDEDERKSCHSDNNKHKGKHRWRKRKVCPLESTDTDPPVEPFEWPDNYMDVKVPPRWSPPRSDSEMYRYVRVASRYVPTVYVKLYIQVPPVTHLCELKTHLLICILRSFFTTTEGLHVNWVMSLQSHVYNLLYMDVAKVRFRRASNGRPCRACLLLSQDATVLVRHKRCSLLSTVADILQIAPEELLVMEKGQRDRTDRETPTTATLVPTDNEICSAVGVNPATL